MGTTQTGIIYGMWKGVKVMVIKPSGKRGTIAPAYDQPEE